VQGIAVFVAVSGAGVALLVLTVAYLLASRYCCCCCMPTQCICLRCGAPYPTPKAGRWGCGFVALPPDGKLQYRRVDRCGARLLMALFALAAT